MTEDKKSAMLEKVRALLAKASDPSIPEAEAQTFREAADRLMTKYAIEGWMIEMAKEGDQRTVQPERRDYPLAWYFNLEYDNPVRSPLWWMFREVARHCRVAVVTSKHFRESGASSFADTKVPIIGLPSDLDYMDMLFTSLMLQMLNQVDPKPHPNLSLEENLAMLREAGLGWEVVTQRLMKAGIIEDPEPGAHFPRKRADWKRYRPESFKVSERLVSKYRKWCKETNRPQTYTNVKTYRREFAAGFESAIASRLGQMRRASQSGFDADHGDNSMALAVRDINQVVQAMMWDIFPDLAPHPADCECDDCHTRKCSDPECSRPRCKAKRKPVRYKPDNRKIDWAARDAGMAAGRKADISNPGSKRVSKTPELPR